MTASAGILGADVIYHSLRGKASFDRVYTEFCEVSIDVDVLYGQSAGFLLCLVSLRYHSDPLETFIG